MKIPNNRLFIMLIFTLLVGSTQKTITMAAMYQKFSDWFGNYSPQEEEYIIELNQLENISSQHEFEDEMSKYSLSNLALLNNFIKRRGLEASYPKFLDEFYAQMILKSGQENELLKEQVESLYDMVKGGDFAMLLQMPLKEKKRYIDYIQKFRQEYGIENAYEELFKLLQTKKIEAVEAVKEHYPTTMQSLLKTEHYPPLAIHIINLNAIELAGPTGQTHYK